MQATLDLPQLYEVQCHACANNSATHQMLQCGRCCEATYCSEACQIEAFPQHNVTYGKPPHPVLVVLISLEKTKRFDEKYSILLTELKSRASVREVQPHRQQPSSCLPDAISGFPLSLQTPHCPGREGSL